MEAQGETHEESAQRSGSREGPWESCPPQPSSQREATGARAAEALGPVAHSPHKMSCAGHLSRDPATPGEMGQRGREAAGVAANRLLPPGDEAEPTLPWVQPHTCSQT